jgi:cation transport ATPase
VTDADDRRKSKKLTRTEIMAMVGGAILAFGLTLNWYNAKNSNASINGESGPLDVSGWSAHPIMRWLLLAAAAAPFILAYIIIRGHQLSWARGEMTAVVAIAAFGLLAYSGLIDRPGEPGNSLIGLKWGWVVAILGTILMLVGSALRASEVERKRKPPGVL